MSIGDYKFRQKVWYIFFMLEGLRYMCINLFTIRQIYNKIDMLLMKNELRNFNEKNNIKFRRRDKINW